MRSYRKGDPWSNAWDLSASAIPRAILPALLSALLCTAIELWPDAQERMSGLIDDSYAFQVFGYIVVFALVFRTQAAYGRFVDACVASTAMSSRWGDVRDTPRPRRPPGTAPARLPEPNHPSVAPLRSFHAVSTAWPKPVDCMCLYTSVRSPGVPRLSGRNVPLVLRDAGVGGPRRRARRGARDGLPRAGAARPPLLAPPRRGRAGGLINSGSPLTRICCCPLKVTCCY